MALRPYQQELVDGVIAAFHDGCRSVVMQSGTGSGKTHTAASIIEYATNRGHRTLFLAHLDALIGDTHARLERAGIRAGFVQADRPTDPDAHVQVASLQTLHARGERPDARFLILDECHRAMGASVRAILDAYPHAWILGLTATPQRGDGKPLGAVFERLVSGPSNRWLTEHGFLVPCEVIAPGNFNEHALVESPVEAYKRETPGRRAIVFAASAHHARRLVEEFEAAGFSTGIMLGDTPRLERDRLRVAMACGHITVLVGVGVFVEGFDLPSIEVVVLARSMSVTGSFLQSIGRGLRLCPETGKTKCTVLDLRGAVWLHGLPDEDRKWSLTGTACARTEKIVALRRCTECLAVYRPATRCPRCGAQREAAETVPRVLRRAEKLDRLNDVPQGIRDRSYVARLIGIARTRMHMDPSRAERWAVNAFTKRFGRKPGAAA